MPKIFNSRTSKISNQEIQEHNYFDFKKLSRNQIIGVSIMAIFMVFILIMTIVYSFRSSGTSPFYIVKGDYVSYIDDWEIQKDDGSFEKASLKNTNFYKTSDAKDNAIVLRKKLSSDNLSKNGITFSTKNFYVKVFVDLNENGIEDNGEELSMNNYNPDELDIESMVWNGIAFNDNSSSHTLYLKLSLVNNHGSILSDLTFGSLSSLYIKEYETTIWPLIIGSIIAFFSIIIALIAFFDPSPRKSAPQLAIIAMFGLFLGLFVIFISGFLQFLTMSRFLWYFLSIVSLIIATWFLSFYFYLKATSIGYIKIAKLFIWVINLIVPIFIIFSLVPSLDINYVYLLIFVVLAVLSIVYLLNEIKASKKDSTQRIFVLEAAIILSTIVIVSLFSLIGAYHAIPYIISINAFTTVLIATIAEYEINILGSKKLIKSLQTEQDQKVAIMLAQIQPHFIYNSLNSIAILCDINAKQAHDLTLKFSQYLRNNIDALSQQTPILFSTELKNIRNYLDIEKVRFADKLNVVENIQVSDFFVPVLSVQPIVENAVKHGISKRSTPGVVMISTNQDLNNYYIIVEDNGVGFDPSILETSEKLGKSIGISNVKYRLKSIMGADVSISSQIGKGTKVIITLPKVTNNIKGHLD